MIHARAALTRQAQEFFHTNLVGIFSWDDVEFAPAEKTDKLAPIINARGRRVRPERLERDEGKFHATVQMEFGIWRLTIKGPNEHPPIGWLKLEGYDIVEGPLDAATWKRFAEHIKGSVEANVEEETDTVVDPAGFPRQRYV